MLLGCERKLEDLEETHEECATLHRQHLRSGLNLSGWRNILKVKYVMTPFKIKAQVMPPKVIQGIT